MFGWFGFGRGYPRVSGFERGGVFWEMGVALVPERVGCPRSREVRVLVPTSHCGLSYR